MTEAALEGLAIILTLERLAWLSFGTIIGLFMGLVPGLGGMVAMSLLLPFVFGMDPFSGIALLIGMMAVVQTGDTFPAVLLGIPGTIGSQATIMDGYPLARQGQARRALSAAFLSSMIGGLIGAAVLFMAIPFARPIVLALRSPDLFMMTLLGITLVATLSMGAPLKALVAGMAGLMMSTVGIAPAATDSRFDAGSLYLLDGFGLIIVALGLFAIPELIELIVENKSISFVRQEHTKGQIRQGFRDVLRNKRIVVQSSVLGPLLGMVPGVGGSIIDWFTYGIASQTTKKDNRFGHGDIRGVIAPESANNAKEGGQLLPTLLFGIPGGGTTAILLGGLTLLGIEPGAQLAQPESLPLLLSIVWTLAIANVLGAVLCLTLVSPISRLTLIPSRKFAPFLFVIVLFASYQATANPIDMAMVLVIGSVAFVMKTAQWPRIPLLLGFILGKSAERYLTISLSRYGFVESISRPFVIFALLLAFLSLGYAVWRSRKSTIEEVIY